VVQKYLIWGTVTVHFLTLRQVLNCGISRSANTGSDGDGRIVKLLLGKSDHQHMNVLDFVLVLG